MVAEAEIDTVEGALDRFERVALAAGRRTNEGRVGKLLQEGWLRAISYSWIRPAIGKRIFVDGMHNLTELRPDRGVLFVSNHRSFFDQYTLLLICFSARIPWSRRLYFPVRANFFYERPLGMAVNYLVAGGAMYPPIYRQKERKVLTDDALDRTVKFLQEPGTVVGLHPEGTRGKGPDPYEFLPAQPGVGKIALLANPTVIPWFIHGLGNDIVDDIRATFKSGVRRNRPVIAVVGEPLDLSDLAAQKPRPTLYKKTADRCMTRIGELSVRERELRADCASGSITDDDSRWLMNWNPPRFFPLPGKA
jgi:1-acyl-sn-glycerol-3-phosphate acyltransferase